MLPAAPFAPISIGEICLLSVANALEERPPGTVAGRDGLDEEMSSGPPACAEENSQSQEK